MWRMSDERLVPRGNALTQVEEITAPNGVDWIAYVEGLPVERPRRWPSRTVLPGRRLRFDSRTDSRVCPELPAGSPFLRQARLIALLAASRPLEEPEPTAPSEEPWRRRWRTLTSGLRALNHHGQEALTRAVDQLVQAFHGRRAGT